MNTIKNYQKGGSMIWVLLLMLAALGAYVYFSQENNTQESDDISIEIPIDQVEEPDVSVSEDDEPALPDNTQQDEEETTTIRVPLFTENSSAETIAFPGCGGYIEYIEYEVPQTAGVLNAVYTKLFELPAGDNNIVATQTGLTYDSVSLDSGVATVKLNGTIMGNHCADAVFRAQIENAAFQYNSVTLVVVQLNGETFDFCSISDADPSESGCDQNPKLWVALNPNL